MRHTGKVLVLFMYTLRRVCLRGFGVVSLAHRLSPSTLRNSRLALVLVLLALPLFSLTRAYVGAPRAYALPSDNLNFQARLETSTGSIAADGYYDIQFNLYSASTGGSSLWNETYSYNSGSGQCAGPLGANDCRVRVANGYVSVYLGSVTSFPGSIPWDQQLYLTMNVGGTTASGPITWDGEMNPRLKLTAVPYAMAAKNAEQVVKSNGANVSTLSIQAPTGGNQTFLIPDQGAAGTYTLLTGSAANGNYIQNQNSTDQAGSFRINGSGRAATLLANTSVTVGSSTTQGQMVLQAGNGFTTTVKSGASAANLTFVLPSGAGSNGNCLLTDGAGQTSWGSCLGGSGSGVTTVGTIDSQTKSTDGAVIGGTTIYMQTAQVDRAGLVGTGAQTFAGNKTFQDGVTLATANTAQDRILIAAANAGTNRFDGTLTNADLTATRTWALPDVSGTVITTGNISAITGLTDSQVSDTLTASIFVGSGSTSNAVDLGTAEVNGTLGLANGGTGATTAQGAINNIAGLTTNGDLLYHNGTNATRLARGTTGQCLTSTATSIQWGSCGLTAETDTLASVTGRGATTTTASSFQGGATVRGLSIDSATATDDLIAMTAAAGGAARFTGTITNADLTGNVTWTLPNVSGTFISTGNLSSITGLTDSQISDTLTASIFRGSGSTTDAIDLGTSEVAGTLADSNVSDTLTIGAAGNVDWTALSNYPAACAAGSAITQLGDSLVCTAFAAASGSGSYINNTTTNQNSANINIQSAATTSVTVKLRAVAAQTADVIQVRNATDTATVFSVNASGNLTTSGTISATNFSGTSSGTNTGDITLSGETYLTLTGQAITVGKINLGTQVSGTLPIASGGTNNSAAIGGAGSIVYSDGTKYVYGATTATAGQCLVSGTSGTGQPQWSNCTAGAGGTTMGGDVTGTVASNTVSKLQNTTLTITSAAANQTLVYDGTAWKNSLLANANLAAGAYSNITGVGTITSGIWQGTAVGATYGGTGLTSVTTGDLLVGGASNTFTKLAAVAAGSCLVSNGVGAAPVWSSCSAAAGGANTSLSNLTATALNQSLIAGTNNNLDLGSSSLAWRNGYFGTAVYGPYFDTASAGALSLGTVNATSLTIGKAGVTTTVNGTVVLSSLTAGLVQSSAGGTLSSGSVDRNSSTFFNTALAVTNGGTGSTTAAGARTNLGAAASGANSDITSLSGLTTALSVGQGGTGASTFTANGVLYGNGTSALQATAASTAAGQCLITVTAGAAPTWGTCTGDGVGLTAEADTLQTVTGRGAITTVASTFQGGATIRGITVDNATANTDKIAVTVNGAAGAGTVFNGTITNADLTAARTWTLPDASGTIAVSASGNIALSATGNITFTGTLGAANGGTGNTTYTTNGSIYYDGTKFVSTAASTAAGQCLLTVTAGAAPTWGTCTGDGVGITSEADTLATVTGRGATTATASTFSGGLTASGAGTGLTVTNNATIGGTLGVTGATTLSGTLVANGNTTIGDATTDRLTLTAQLLGGAPIVFQGATDNGFATTLALTDPTANNTITLPNASGTVALLGAIALGADTTGNYVAGITAGNGISVSGAAGEGWSPSIAVNYGSAANTAVQGNVTLTCPSGTGNLTGGGTSITLGTGGTCAAISTVNNPSFSTSVTTPLLQSSGAFTLTPAGAMTLGATGQTFTLQGNGTSVITSTTSGFTTTVGFAGVPTANTRYNFDATAAAGTYTICTTAGNCAGNGSTALAGDVTGTTGANTISALKGTTVTITSLASGNVLSYNGTAWVNSLISNSNLASGSYTNITGVGTLAGLTASGTITFSGLNSVGIVTTNASGVLSTGALDRNSASYFNTALSVANGGTGATTAAGARTNLGAAASGANSDITSLSGLTTALSVGQGGTGAATAQGAINNLSGLTTNGDILYHNGTNTTRLARGTNGQCLSSTATSIQWASCGLGAEADTLATVTARGATTTVASSFQGGATIRGVTVDSATVTDDIISVAITSTAGSRFTGTITNADLTANRTWTLPDASGTFITTGNLASITGTGTITSGVWNGTALTDAYVSDTLTSSIFRGTGSTTDAIDLGTAEVAGTLADGNVSDTLTIGAAGTVDWGALNAYPAACAAGSAITALGDTITCSAFMTATASNVFVNGGNSFGAAAVLGTNDTNSLSLKTNGVNRMTIDATGATSFTGSVAAASISTSGNIAATGTISASNFSGSHSGTSSGTNTGDVTVSGQNYITISGQALTVGQINLGGTHVTGALADANVADNITISSAGSVDWAALNNYPAACASGAITALGDTITCSNFATGTAANYIQNGTALQTSANMAIQSATTNNVTVAVRALASQTSDLLQFQASGGGLLGGFNTSGNLYYASGAFRNTISTNALTANRSIALPDASGTVAVSASGNIALSATGDITLVNAPTISGLLTANTGVTLGAAAGSGAFLNNGSTVNTTLALGNLAAGAIGTAAATVDAYSSISIAPTAAGRTYTVPDPTTTTAGRVIYISNANTTNSFTLSMNAGVLTTTVLPGNAATLIWNGADWTLVTGAASAVGANTTLSNLTPTNINQALNTTSGNLQLTTTTSGNIVLNSAGTIELQDNTNVTGNLSATTVTTAQVRTDSDANGIRFQNAAGTTAVMSIDTTNSMVGVGTVQPMATLDVVSTTAAKAGTGTISSNTSDTTITGAGTLFTTQVRPGDTIIASATGQARTVLGVTNNTSLVVANGTPFTPTLTNSAFTIVTPAQRITSSAANQQNLAIVMATGQNVNPLGIYGSAGQQLFQVTDSGAGMFGSFVQSNSGVFKSAFAMSATFMSNGSNLSSGDVTVQSGNAASGTSGSIFIDSGTASATTGAINIGVANTRAINIGNTTGTTTVNITAGATGAINIGDNAGNSVIDIAGVNNSGADTVNIATNATAADTINVGNSNAGTALSLTAGISAIQMSNNSVNTTINYTSNAYNIQSFSGSSYFTINNSANGGNLITNPSAELNLTGWSARTGTTLTRNTTLLNVYFGAASVRAANTATANAGVNYAIQLSPNTTYYMQVLVKNTALNTIRMGYSSDGATETNYTDTVLGTTGDWTRIGYSVTTPATVNASAYIFIKQVSATAGTLYLDGLSTQSNGFVAWTYQESQISLGNSATPVVVGSVPAYGVQATTNAALFVQQSRPGVGLIVQGAKDADLYGDPIMAVQTYDGTRILQAGSGGIPKVVISGGFSAYGDAALEVNSKDPGAPATVLRGANGQTANIFDIRDNTDSNIVSVNTDGLTINQQSNNVTLGAELYSGNFSAGWTTTNWTLGGGGTTAKHITGNTASLTNTSIAIATASSYQVSFTVTEPSGSGCNTGSYIVASLGGKSSSQLAKGVSCDGTYTVNFLKTTSTAKLAFAPSSTWNGTIRGISIKQITAFNDVAALSVQGGDPNMTLNYMGTTGELRLTLPTTPSNSGQIRLITDPSNASNYASVLINDGAATYFKLTAANNPYGNFTAANPFSINNANGRVTIGNGLTVSGSSILGGATTINNTLAVNDNVTISGSAASTALGVSTTYAAGYAMTIENSATTANADGLQIKINVANGTKSNNNRFIDFADAGGIQGSIRGVNGGSVTYSTAAGDYAEYFKVNPANKPQVAELVALDGQNGETVRHAANGEPVVGVVSAAPGVLGNAPVCAANDNSCEANYESNHAIIGLMGQVPLKVTGGVQIGDALGASHIPGVAAKVNHGYIVGYAMTTPDAQGRVSVLLRQGYIGVDTSSLLTQNSFANLSGINVTGNAQFASINVTGNLSVAGNVTVAGTLETADIYVGGHIVTKGSAPVATTGVALGVLGASTYTPAVVNDGTDAAGTVTVTAGGEQLTSGVLAHITFNKAFSQSYKVVVSGGNERATDLRVYVVKTAAGFDIVTRDAVTAGTQYTFDYMVTGAQN
ncbi:MAG: peptidase G2 autoproteolytic cleavage domain-containing protein [Candidatus Saccharimonadales bacterium]